MDLNLLLEKVLLNLKVPIEENDARITTDRRPTISAYEAHCGFIAFKRLHGQQKIPRTSMVSLSASESSATEARSESSHAAGKVRHSCSHCQTRSRIARRANER